MASNSVNEQCYSRKLDHTNGQSDHLILNSLHYLYWDFMKDNVFKDEKPGNVEEFGDKTLETSCLLILEM